MAKNTNGLNVSATIREFVLAGNGQEYTVNEILDHVNAENVRLNGSDALAITFKQVYGQSNGLVTNNHLGKGYGTKEEKFTLIHPDYAPSVTERFLRHQQYKAQKLEEKKNAPKPERKQRVSNAVVKTNPYTPDEVLDQLRELLNEVDAPSDPKAYKGIMFPVVGDKDATWIIEKADGELARQGKDGAFQFHVGKSGSLTVVYLQPRG